MTSKVLRIFKPHESDFELFEYASEVENQGTVLNFKDLYQPDYETLLNVASYLPFLEGKSFLNETAKLDNDPEKTKLKIFSIYLKVTREFVVDKGSLKPELLQLLSLRPNIQTLFVNNENSSTITDWALLKKSTLKSLSFKGSKGSLIPSSCLQLFSNLPRTIEHIELDRIKKTAQMPILDLNQLKNLKSIQLHHTLLSNPKANDWFSDFLDKTKRLDSIKILGWSCNPGKKLLQKLNPKSLEIRAPWFKAEDLYTICSKNRIEHLTIRDCKQIFWTEFGKVVNFPSVISLNTNCNVFSWELDSINKLFPNLVHLHIDGVISSIEHAKSSLCKFKNLEVLKLPDTILSSELINSLNSSAKKHGHSILIESKSKKSLINSFKSLKI